MLSFNSSSGILVESRIFYILTKMWMTSVLYRQESWWSYRSIGNVFSSWNFNLPLFSVRCPENLLTFLSGYEDLFFIKNINCPRESFENTQLTGKEKYRKCVSALFSWTYHYTWANLSWCLCFLFLYLPASIYQLKRYFFPAESLVHNSLFHI